MRYQGEIDGFLEYFTAINSHKQIPDKQHYGRLPDVPWGWMVYVVDLNLKQNKGKHRMLLWTLLNLRPSVKWASFLPNVMPHYSPHDWMTVSIRYSELSVRIAVQTWSFFLSRRMAGNLHFPSKPLPTLGICPSISFMKTLYCVVYKSRETMQTICREIWASLTPIWSKKRPLKRKWKLFLRPLHLLQVLPHSTALWADSTISVVHLL